MLHDIHITKAGKSAFLKVDDALLSDDMLAAVIREGLKACLNAKMTKITGMKDLEGEALAKLQADAMEIAKKNLAALADGTYKFPGTKAKATAPREVQNEAIRLAREVVRDALRAANITISHVPAKDITAAAKALVEQDESYLRKAEENLAKRKETPSVGIDLAALGIRPDPEKVAKAEKAKAERNERAKTLSATQAGKTKARTTKAKPKASAADVLAGLGASKSHDHAGNVTH